MKPEDIRREVYNALLEYNRLHSREEEAKQEREEILKKIKSINIKNNLFERNKNVWNGQMEQFRDMIIEKIQKRGQNG